MDSVTQIALGAAMGELALGRKIGRLAPLVGGVLGTLPDLDVLYRFDDPIANFTYHRAASHSVIVLAVAAPIIAEILHFAFRKWHPHRAGWYLLAFLALLTHPVLDCFTVYGTQILWPLDETPQSWATIFIIDPAYSVPLFAALIFGLIVGRKNGARTVVTALAVLMSSAYLGFTYFAKQAAEARAVAAMEQAGIEAEAYVTLPGPFTSLLWRVTAVDQDNYYNSYISLLDPPDQKDEFVAHARNMDLLEGITDTWGVQRLAWFSHGIYSVSAIGDHVAISDLRMGLEPWYVFNFKVGTRSNPHTKPLEPAERYELQVDPSELLWAWERLWSPDLPLRP